MKKILFILFILSTSLTQAQTIQYLGSPTTQIYVRGQMRIDTVVYLPLRDTTFTPSQIGALIVKGQQAYLWNGVKWITVSMGPPVYGTFTGNIADQVDLQNALNSKQATVTAGYGIKKTGVTLFYDSATVRKVDTLFAANDSTITYTVNGMVHAALLRGTAAGGINSLILNVGGTPFIDPITFSHIGGAWNGSMILISQNANAIWSGPPTGGPAQPTFRALTTGDLPTGIPNGNLQNSTLSFTTTTTGSDISITPSSVPLGGLVTLNAPNAGPSARGPLTAADWTSFNNKPISVNGQTGIVVTKNADSIKSLPVDTTNNRDNYLLTFDSTNHKWKLTAGATAGVTSVGLTAPSFLNVTGSPVTSSGTLAMTLANQTQNKVFVSPDGSTGTPTFRAMANADLPTSGVTPGTYNSITVNAQGIAIAASNVGSGITSLNGLTGATQTFAAGTSGSDFNISSSGTTHTFNLPTGDASHRGAISSADWSNFTGKKDNIDSVGPTGYASHGRLKKVADSLGAILAAQDLQQTVTIGNRKNLEIIDSVADDSTNGTIYWQGHPSNYNVSYPGFGKGKGFLQGWNLFPNVNLPITRPNMVGLAWAYNATPGGAILDNAELAGFGFRTETAYNLNFAGSLATEIHWPEFYANHGALTERLWSYYIDNTTGATQHQSQIQSMNWDTKNTNQGYFAFGTATTNHDSSVNSSESWILGVGSAFNDQYTKSISYRDAYWAPLTENYDRGSYSLRLGTGNSWNGYRLSFNGAVDITGVAGQGSNYIYLHNTAGQDIPTFITTQMISSTFANNPTYSFDRRNGSGSILIGDGKNGGELSWQGATFISGIANGTYASGTGALFDIVAHGFDVDNADHANFTMGRNGDFTSRKSGIVGGALSVADTVSLNQTPLGASTDSVLVKHGNTVRAVGSTPLLKYQHAIFTPTTGGTVNLVNGKYNIINPAGALLALTVNLPSSPADNDVVYIKFTQTITTVTYANGTVVDGITGPAAGGLVVLTYDSGITSWY